MLQVSAKLCPTQQVQFPVRAREARAVCIRKVKEEPSGIVILVLIETLLLKMEAVLVQSREHRERERPSEWSRRG